MSAAQQKALARQMIASSKGLTRATLKSGLAKTPTASAFCGNGGVGAPGPGCSLYNPASEPGFEGSIIKQMGGSQIVDPSTCAGAGVGVPPDHTIGGHLDTSVGCPEDGDVLMWRAGTGTCPGRWVNASLKEAFARACLSVPDDLADEDCAVAKAPYEKACCSATSSAAPKSILARASKAVSKSSAASASAAVSTGKTFGSGADGDLTLQSDSELTTDMYFRNLNLNGYTLYTNGYRLFVSASLSAGRHEKTGRTGTIACDGEDGTAEAPGKGGAAATLGGGASGNSTIDYSISGSAGSNGKGGVGPAAQLVSELEGGLGLLSELDSAVRMRALDGRRLTGGAGAVGPHAGGGGGVVFVAAHNTLLGGTLRARGGITGASDSGAGGGGAVVFVHADPTTWQFDLAGGDAVAEAGKAYDIRV